MVAVEDAELVDRVLLQLVQRRNRLGPGREQVWREAMRLEARDVGAHLRLLPLGEGGEVERTRREHRPGEVAVERSAQGRLLPRAELPCRVDDPRRHVLEETVDR